jgi:hypothetical protein
MTEFLVVLEARSLSLSFSKICEGVRFWQSGNLSYASSSSLVSVMNLDDEDDGDDVGVRIQDTYIEFSSSFKVFMYDLLWKYNLGW